MSLKNILNDFEDYSWWKKALLFLPFVIVTIILTLFLIDKDSIGNNKVVEHSKKKTDQDIDEFDRSIKTLKKQRKEIANKREEIRKELTDAKANYISVANDIDSADPNDLDVVAQKLRANTTSNKHRP